MSANPGSIASDDAAAAVDAILARTEIPVSATDRDRLIRFYPLVRGWMERLRMVEARYADPALIFPAAPHD